MRIEDILYFAPGVKFSEIDFDGRALPEQFESRVKGFYLDPADVCIQSDHAFAAGVLLVSCIDSLARLRFGNGVGTRIKRFARCELQSFSTASLAERFHDDVRNGLVHESRLKRGTQFSLEVDQVVREIKGRLVINPKYLALEVRGALDRYVALLKGSEVERKRLANKLKQDHIDDLRP